MLSDNDYLTGTNICGADATLYAFMTGILAPFFESHTRPIVLEHHNIVAYCDRMKRRFHPDMN